MQAKVISARFYADHILILTGGLRDAIIDGAQSVNALPMDAY